MVLGKAVMCPSPQGLHKQGLPRYSNEGSVFFPKPFSPYKTESQQSHPRSLSALAMPIQGSPALKVQAGQSPHTTPPVFQRVLQVLHVCAVAVAQEETCGHLLTHWDEWLEQNMSTSLQGSYFSKRQARVRSVASATSSVLFCWVLREACP